MVVKAKAQTESRITAIVQPEELAVMEILANKDRRSVSAYARGLILAEIERAKIAKLFTDEDVKAQIKSWLKESK